MPNSADTDISHATYHLSLAEGVEHDIRDVLVNGKKCNFDIGVFKKAVELEILTGFQSLGLITTA